MPLSWNEIRANAIAFARDWAGEARESAERQTFWNEFFAVFGVKRRVVASFEEPVKKLSGTWGAIDLFWKGKLLVEHKSRGKPLDQANAQAMEYIQGLKTAGRDDEIPQYVVVSDFARLAVHDLDAGAAAEFPLAELPKHVHRFAFIPGYKVHALAPQDPVNVRAVLLLGRLHDALKAGGYAGPDLERFLVRVLFCLFAEDTGLFEPEAFKLLVDNHSKPDGADLGPLLERLFRVLDTPPEKRQAHLMEELAALPHVNGHLFADRLDMAEMTRAMRDALLTCCGFDWSRISPAIFGSLFQTVLETEERRRVGAHYTSERDILKLVRSLFLDDLRAEFDRLAASKGTQRDARLRDFHQRLGRLTFLDPACGCGNFLVVTYRELRLLEIDLLLALRTDDRQVLDVRALSVLDVDALYGIEIGEFPARIAEVALWLVDHQMNQRLGEAFGQVVQRLPLSKSATIRHANALRIDWNEVLPAGRCGYVLGNPPFVGHQWRTDEQQADMALIWGTDGRFGRLDYVTAWYRKAADYTAGTAIRCGFVSTNSITQGEQVGTLWGHLLRRGVKIIFAHRTFVWKSEARGAAHVHVVIVGFAHADAADKRLYDYDQNPDQPSVTTAANINPYLVAGSDLVLPSRTDPPAGLPQMKKGSQPTDGGHLILTDAERADLVAAEPRAEVWLRKYIGGEELINGWHRWCLWLKDADPSALRQCPRVLARVAGVRESRLKSPTKSVREFADRPTLFTQDRQPTAPFLGLSEVSSENRRYLPIAFLQPDLVPANTVQVVVGATVYHFGILSSGMHLAWVRVAAGRLKSDYRYTPAVYNNFPWPDADAPHPAAVATKAQAVLDARGQFPSATLADLYDPLTMPPALVAAHAELDRAVERGYRPEPFRTDRERVEFLFARYERLAAPLTAPAARPRGRRPGGE